MIKIVRLHNFLSYADAAVDLGSDNSVAMIGTNGCGKSAFLESIVYGFYGLHRYKVNADATRRGQDAHFVEIIMTDETGADFRLKRGVQRNGKGFLKWSASTEEIAEGQEAQAEIDRFLGMSQETFMLTAYFGMGGRSDTLVDVIPSTRLETLQQIANISVYQKFLSRADKRYKVAGDAVNTERAKVDQTKHLLDGIETSEELSENIKGGEKQLEDLENKLAGLRQQRKQLQEKEDKYRALLNEKSVLESGRKELRQRQKKLENRSQEIESFQKTDMEEFASMKQQRAERALSLQGIDVEKARESLQSNRIDYGRLTQTKSMKEAAVTFDDVKACPLCGSDLSDDMLGKWKQDIQGLDKQVEDMKALATDANDLIANYTALQNEITELDSQMKTLQSEIDSSQKNRKDVAAELKEIMGEIGKKDDRYVKLAEQVGDNTFSAEIAQVNHKIEMAHSTVGEVKSNLQTWRKRTKQRKTFQSQLSQLEESLNKHETEALALAALKEAWSRYGIPLNLIRSICAEIEERASAVFQEFGNGRIVVTEVEERGKPGIEFLLADQTGSRPFHGLSTGEKVMFFLAIRIAIAQIVESTQGINNDILILDEVLGNLAPERRDDLVRLVNKVLRKIFPRIVMVSHTPLPNIFERVLYVTMENGESKIQG